jgi:hypothetical protein
MALLKTLIVYSLAFLSIIFLYFVYQTKQITDRENRPIYSNFKPYDVVCPDDYYYTGTNTVNSVEQDQCTSFLDDDYTKSFPTLIEDGNIDLTDIENMVKQPKISARCKAMLDDNVTFSALKPYCDNDY